MKPDRREKANGQWQKKGGDCRKRDKPAYFFSPFPIVHLSGAIGTDAIASEARDLPPETAELGAFRPERYRIRPKNGEREPSVMASESPTTEVQIH